MASLISKQRIIGITGGIACGKTTVANYLSDRHQLPILDADILARQALTAENLKLIGDRYGQRVFLPDGSLDRPELGRIIFTDQTERQWLESIIHPYIKAQLIAGAQKYFPETLVMVVPLLFEAKMTNLVTEIWLVTCPYEIQLERLMTRNKLTRAEAEQRINSQMPASDKLPFAHCIIDTALSLPELYQGLTKHFYGTYAEF